VYRSVQSSTDSVHSVKPCISGNLSVGSVTLYKSVWHCIGKGWFADEDSYCRVQFRFKSKGAHCVLTL